MDKPIVFTHHIDYQYNTIANTVKTVYQNAYYWNREKIFDFLKLNSPSFFIGPTESFNDEVCSALKKYGIPVIVYGVAIPNGIEHLVQCVLVPANTPRVLTKNIDHKHVLTLEHSANIININKPIYDPSKELDILAIELSKFSRADINTLSSIPHKYHFRVYLDSHQYIPNYAGSLASNHGTYIFNSKVTLDFNHSIRYDVAFNKGSCLSNRLNDTCSSYSDIEELLDYLKTYTKNSDWVSEDSKIKAYEYVLESHTCFHRAAQIFSTIGQEQLAKKSVELVKNYIW